VDTQAWVALSAVVAALSFVYSIWIRRKTDRQAELLNWQRVVIYSLIEEAEPISFDDLKSRYLRKAKELLSHKVPAKVIQDDSLKRILLDLQKDGVVMRRTDLSYQIQVKLPMDASTVEDLKRILLSKAR
jgi:hypothetical protein